jgi:hypothetical protein
MPVPRFDTIEEAAAFVVQHHRLPQILSVADVADYIRFIYAMADGDMSLASLTMQFFRGKIERADNELGGQ